MSMVKIRGFGLHFRNGEPASLPSYSVVTCVTAYLKLSMDHFKNF
jgi:hypothetical protein